MAEWADQLTELVATRGAELQRYGFLLTGDRAEAADLVQEALVRVFARPRRAWRLGEIEGYVRRTMLNRYLDLYRRRARYRALVPQLAEDPVGPDGSEQLADRLQLMVALGTLSPTQRACVVLRYYEDLPVAAVAERLGRREGTVKRHLSDALERLGVALTDACRELGEGVSS
ncbi:sigma-70 family RNA polymerase sigma factor [Kitasatospora sp. NPDC051984]|uniref:sigma-70 family RNA polymerase sigma factor n=1 Tax=Kitasatospora sp. NPDC051984 TaxID=3364059 RepID=UPI0037CA29EF